MPWPRRRAKRFVLRALQVAATATAATAHGATRNEANVLRHTCGNSASCAGVGWSSSTVDARRRRPTGPTRPQQSPSPASRRDDLIQRSVCCATRVFQQQQQHKVMRCMCVCQCNQRCANVANMRRVLYAICHNNQKGFCGGTTLVHSLRALCCKKIPTGICVFKTAEHERALPEVRRDCHTASAQLQQPKQTGSLTVVVSCWWVSACECVQFACALQQVSGLSGFRRHARCSSQSHTPHEPPTHHQPAPSRACLDYVDSGAALCKLCFMYLGNTYYDIRCAFGLARLARLFAYIYLSACAAYTHDKIRRSMAVVHQQATDNPRQTARVERHTRQSAMLIYDVLSTH